MIASVEQVAIGALDIHQVGRDRWDRFVQSHPGGSVYHSSSWHRVIERTYGCRCVYVVLLEKGDIRAGLPCAQVRNLLLGRRLVAFPYSDHCDPLVSEPEEFKPLIATMQAASPKLEVRCTFPPGDRTAAASPYHNFILPLQRDTDALFRRFHKSCVQRAIRKAERAGIQIVRGTGERDLREFFRLHVGTRRRLGVPAQPFRFFRNLGEEFGAGRLVVLLAQKGGVALAGLILLKFKDTVYYKFGASRTRFWSLRPNHLLFWTAIRQSAEECYRFFEFGRTSEADTGLMNFKRRWGADSFPLHYLSYGPGEQRLDSLEQGRLRAYLGRMLRILPASFTRVSGQLLYPYLG